MSQGKSEETDRKKAEKVALACLSFRKGKEWTREQLAAHLGVTSVTVREWERGRKIPSFRMIKLMRERFYE